VSGAFFLKLATIGALALLIPATALAETPVDYPKTSTVPVAEPQFGETVADPYRWLEDDVRTSDKVRDWVTAQNAVSETYLKSLPGRDVFAARMRQLFDYERMGLPRKAGKRYFYSRNSGLQNQSTLWVRDGLAGAARQLIDPNAWAKDGATALAEWTPSDDGRFLAYSVQDGGTDWRTIRVMDVATGKPLGDEIKWAKYSGSVSWKPDGSGFFYSRFAAPEPGETYQALTTDQSVYYHKVGTSQDQDVKVYATPDKPKFGHFAQVTDDGRYVVVTSTLGTDPRNDVHVARLTKKGAGSFKPIASGLANDWSLAGSVGRRFWFRTDKGAPRGRITVVDVDAAKPRFDAVVPETADTLVGASLVGNRLILAYLGDAKSEAALYELDGRRVGPVPLPDIGTAGGFGGITGDSESFYSFSGFAQPATIYRYDTATNRAVPFFQPKLAFDPAAFETRQVFYASKDGTKVPMFIIGKKGLTGPQPTLLYGYGGFNVSMTPGFSATRLAWLEQGGVLAIANLRGGGEYGKDWHDAGRLARKQNVFDDFIAAGEWLVAQGITSKAQLAIQGGSNGGLLVGAVVNQRPDLFAAALPAVGVMDMLRFNRFTAGRYWTDDYGDPGVEADFKVLRAYSPYHNIRASTPYPAILVTTADTDDRVVPGHSFKYTAALQAASLGEKPRIIRIETRAGHGSGKPIDKTIAEAADLWAFAAKWTGMTVRK
jgi:prolyl oligopeptidase